MPVSEPPASRIQFASRASGTLRTPWAGLVVAFCALLSFPACGEDPTTPNGQTARDSAPDEKAQKPLSIILMSLDTMRRDHVGFYGYERNTTPFLDELAERSLVFDNAYTTFSWTLVAHMSLMTGMYPSQHGVWREDAALPPSVPTLAERLHESGYYTMGFHDSRWLGERYGFARGYDVYSRHQGAPIAERHIELAMDERPKDKPFFMFIHLMDIHNAPLKPGGTMYEPPEPFNELFMLEPEKQLEGLDPEAAWARSDGITPEQHEALVALYDGGIRYVDTKVGEWVEQWWKAGLLDNTLLIITSDHGESLDQRGTGYGGHGFAFNEGLRVPLMIHFPGDTRGGERVAQPVSLVDILPTVLDGLDFEPDARLPGYSLLDDGPEDRVIYAQQPDRMEAFIRWPWKLLRPAGENAHMLRLFNLEQDPEELEPLTRDDVGDSPFKRISRDLGQSVTSERNAWYQPEEPNPDAGPLSPEAEAALKALGYLGDG